MDKLTAETIALVLLFVAFPLTSIGATGGIHGYVMARTFVRCPGRSIAHRDTFYGSLQRQG